MELNSQALVCFLAVAEHESYTKAAASLTLSQPGVHQHVRKLEAQLRTKLVEQHGKRVVLTEHGRVVYQFARRWQDDESDLVRYLRDDVSLDQGQLRIAAGTTAAEFIIPTMAVAFQRLHPGIHIRVYAAGTNDEVDSGVAARSFDLGIHSDSTPRPGLEKAAFLADTLIGIGPAGHRLSKLRRAITPQDLASEPFIHFGPSEAVRVRIAPIQTLINEWFAAAGVESTSRLTVGALEGIKHAVRDGGGVAIVSRYAVDPDDPRLAIFRLASPPERCFYLVSRDRGWESNVVRAFREFVISLDWTGGDPRGFEPPRTERKQANARAI
ncbi:MAG: hypothetical protein C0506_10870 [Anaerolinea sp.]|nr:hypothetical protein [Anaerolinea sp.]